MVHRALPLALLLVAGCSEGAPGSDVPSSEHESKAPPASKASPPASSSEPGPAPSASTPSPSTAAPITFQLLTYNVAGLPQGISGSDPLPNTPQMSPRLNPFDVVVVQEDFTYHDALVSAATHPHKSTPMTGSSLGDGLNTLSRFDFSEFTRTKWNKCNGLYDQGSDCATPKGFTRFVVDLGGGRKVDVYDVHFDAGRGDADVAAREEQVGQLLGEIAMRSVGRAVIVAGDTNMKASDEASLLKLLGAASLEDACRSLSCSEPARIDRVMLRSSPTLKLTAKSWNVESSFVDASGNPLSDHQPVSVTIQAD